ncbi:hypothetical protein, partial [Zavarzinia sp.]|uniref:hypothetical protein n=1 Tax=Zavarzinia sp. TaxID=2027920 RepID=UPI00356A5BE4
CKDWACRVGIGYRLDRAIARRSDATVAPEPPAEIDVPVEMLPDPPAQPAPPAVCEVNLAGPKLPPALQKIADRRRKADMQQRAGSGVDCVDCPEGKECSGCEVYATMQGKPAPAPICTACGLSPADDGDGLCKLCRRGRAEGASIRGKVARKRESPPTVDLTIRAALLRAVETSAAIPIAAVALVEAVRKIRPTASPNGIQVELAKTSRAGLIQRVDRGFYAPIGWMPKRG